MPFCSSAVKTPVFAAHFFARFEASNSTGSVISVKTVVSEKRIIPTQAIVIPKFPTREESASPPMKDQDDFLANLISAGSVDGKLAMMPVQVTNYMLIYRKDLYEEAGLDPENPPATWEDLAAAAEKLTKRDDLGITVAGLQLPIEYPRDCSADRCPA